MAILPEARDQLALKFEVLLPHLNERQRRLLLRGHQEEGAARPAADGRARVAPCGASDRGGRPQLRVHRPRRGAGRSRTGSATSPATPAG